MAGGNSADLLERARAELYRGQCNCAYWHGAFGGIYLPHLRNAVYNHLIAAENFAFKGLAVGKLEQDFVSPIDHVVVCEDVPLFDVDEET